MIVIDERKKEMVMALIQDKQYHPMKLREIAGFLQVPKSQRAELNAILDTLTNEGRIGTDREGRYIPISAVTAEGIFQSTDRGFGFVTVDGETDDWFIPEEATMNAVHGDRVCVVRVKCGSGTDNGKKIRTEGRITKILERNTTELVGIFHKSKNFGFVVPDRSKLNFDVHVSKEHTKGAVSGQKVCVKITDFGDDRHQPEGRITEILGHINDPGVDILSVVKDYALPTEFPDAVKAQLETVPEEVSEEQTEGRLDLRDVMTVTIDGEEAKDLDDAISLTMENGHYILGVHIADVSHYVTENSPLDREAINRGTSVYLTDRVIPMLPHALSNGICSLNMGEDRLALSCIMEVDGSGAVVSHKICESVIRVNHRMSYTKVFQVLQALDVDGNGDNPVPEYEDAVPMLLQMNRLSLLTRARRENRGAIDFDFPESKILLDEKGKVTSIVPHERNRATELIEDFMLLANETVAEEFFWLQLPFVYRIHEEPDFEKMEDLRKYVSHFGYSMHLSNETVHAKEVQKLLKSIQGAPEENLLSRLTLRSMKQAKYSTECLGHFGLAAKYYCHFTSPIRRYPDLQIHRIIKEYLHGNLSEKRISHYEAILPERAKQSSMTERRSEEAEREVEKMKKAEYMRGFLGETFDGLISGITSWGIYVELPNTVEGMVRLTDLRGDYFRFDAKTMTLTGEHTRKCYTIGQPMKVLVAAADKMTRTIDFVPAK